MKMTPQQAAAEIARTVLADINAGKPDAKEQPVAIIPIGVPGSGKSTFVSLLREKFEEYGIRPFTVASTDDLIEAWGSVRGLTYSEAWDQCPMKEFNTKFKEEIELAVLLKTSLFIDRTNMGKKTRRGHLAMITDDYKKICLNFDVNTDILKARLNKRAESTGKIITPMVLGSMFKNYEPPTKDEGFDLIITVDNNRSH